MVDLRELLMKVMISGGTGRIGWALAQDLAHDGHEAILLTRKTNPVKVTPKGIRFLHWDGISVGDWANELETTDAVVNLAGESLSARLWSKKQKDRLIMSRVKSGHALSKAIERSNHKPGVLIQTSGVGAYGVSEDQIFTEADPYGQDFMAGITRVWEVSTLPVEAMGVRRVIIRLGVVFSKDKGALKLLLLPFRLFVGGRMGNGRQWISWIHQEDETKAIRFLIENDKAQGVFNLSAEPVRNMQFAQSAGKALHRPCWFPLPGFALRLILGEMSTTVLEGQNVSSQKLTDFGYHFIYPEIDSALKTLV